MFESSLSLSVSNGIGKGYGAIYFSLKVNDDCRQFCMWLLHPLSRAFADVTAPDPLFIPVRQLPYIVVGICGFANNTVGVCKQNASRFTPATLQKLSLRILLHRCSCCITTTPSSLRSVVLQLFCHTRRRFCCISLSSISLCI